MIIKGLQKLTILDFPDRVACIVFTGGCNFRCPFCQNAVLVNGESEEIIPLDDFFKFLKERKGRLDGVSITGGEPCMQKGIVNFARAIKFLGYDVKIDTNGYLPEVLEELIENKVVDYIAMDIKNSKGKYALTAGIKNLDLTRIEKSISLIRNSGIAYEFRTTVVKEFHEADDFREIGEWLRGADSYFLQKFRDEGGTLVSGLTAPTDTEMAEYKEILKVNIPSVNIR